MATGFQTYKQTNNGCNCEHVSVGVFSCKRWGRRKRQVLKFLIQSLWDVALCQLLKVNLLMRIILLTFLGSSNGRNFCLFFKTLLFISRSLSCCPIPLCDKNKKGFQILNLIWFFGLFVTTVLSVISLLIFIFYFMQDVPFYFCWKNHLDLSHSVCLFLYYLVHFESP